MSSTSSASTGSGSAATTPAAAADPCLPALKPADFRQYNRLAEHMSHFHNHFKYEFRKIWNDAAEVDLEDDGSLESFLEEAESIYTHLDMHHSIEERYIFPVLARRMPQFQAKGQHLDEHKQMHAGLVRYHDYLNECREDESNWSLAKLRDFMAAFEKVLFEHMDEEVASLGAESMRKAGWTLQELKQIPM